MRTPHAHNTPQPAPPHAERGGGSVVAFPQPACDPRELVSGLLARQAQSITQLFDEYHEIARCSMVRILGNAVDVDDLVQETFMVVIDKVPEIRKPEALRSFVVSVAMRIAKNELRRRAVRRFVRWSDAPPPVATCCSDPNQRAVVTAVYRALDQLDANSRVLFVMRHVEGWELKELAQTQRCSLATLKRRLQKAEKRFRAAASRQPALRELLEASA